MQINITAIIKSKPETIQITKALLLEMVVESRKEPACIKYDLHQSIEKPSHFIFHEIWENEAGLELHNKKPYLLKFKEQAPILLAETPKIYRTNTIS